MNQNLMLSRIRNRQGIVMFVVLGAILVLGILVVSYNFFVRGKFNESREILKHLRATKCAQATSNFVFAHLLNDLSNSEPGSMGESLRSQVFIQNDPSKLASALKSIWFGQIGCTSFVHTLLDGTVGDEEIKYEVDFGFNDIKPLKSLNTDKNVFFYDFEKVGRLTIRVTICIGRTREVWQETRPFKVVFPFPVPLTKFSFYWKKGVSNVDPYAFNTVCVSANDGKPTNGKYPFLFDNGSIVGNENKEEDVWMKRGWIYVGGGDLCLNRACGDKAFGQRFYSYPRPGAPATLMLEFPGGDRWGEPGYEFRSGKLGFRVAHWGFSDALFGSDANSIWRKILRGEFREFPPNINHKYWNSSALHLFSDTNVLSSKSDKVVPSITRVMGKVQDRFLELGYLLPTNSSTDLFAAVINYYDKEDFDEAAKRSESSGGDNIKSDYSFDKFLYFSKGDPFSGEGDLETANMLERYFNQLEFYDNDNPNALAYSSVMSRMFMRTIDETYDVVSAYSANSNHINLPPLQAVPRTTDLKFRTQGNYPIDLQALPGEVAELSVPAISEVEDSSLGLDLRTCYEITAPSDKIMDEMLSAFGSYASGFGLDLNNLVYKVSPTDGKPYLTNITVKTPGTIFSDEGIRIGTFAKSGDAEKAPLMILAKKGAISIDNAANNEVRAYLVALGEEGTIKANNNNATNAPLCIRGGIAVNELSADDLPKSGGYCAYNLALDPISTDRDFRRFAGVVFGPKGGGL